MRTYQSSQVGIELIDSIVALFVALAAMWVVLYGIAYMAGSGPKFARFTGKQLKRFWRFSWKFWAGILVGAILFGSSYV
jgi:hypothetical protein